MFQIFQIPISLISLDIPECVLYLSSLKEEDSAGAVFKFTPFQSG
jgi:hypothetical protein